MAARCTVRGTVVLLVQMPHQRLSLNVNYKSRLKAKQFSGRGAYHRTGSTLSDVCDVTTFSGSGDQINASITRRTAHRADVLVGDAVIGTYWHVEWRTRRRADTDASVTYSAVWTDYTDTHF